MKKIIYLLIFLIFSILIQGKNYLGETTKLYSNENLVVNTTSRINFFSEINILKEDIKERDFFQLNLEKTNPFINITNIKIVATNGIREGNRIYFINSSNKKILKEIKVSVEGEILFNWLTKKNKTSENIQIGYINSKDNPVYLTINLEDFNPIYSLKVKVVDNMNLGRVQAGEKLSTNNMGTPANISIEGEKNKSVSITIPKETIIKNSKNDTLIVKLNFRDNKGQKLIRQLSPNGKNTYELGDKGSVISKDILIDGESQTKKNTRGIYRGVFTVRVEYLD